MKTMASCYAVDSSMAEVYCNLPTISTACENNSSNNGIDTFNRKDVSETLSNSYYGNHVNAVSATCSLQNGAESHHSRTLSSDSVKSEFYADVEKTDASRMVDEDSALLTSISSIKQGEESIPRIFTMDMDVEEESKELVDDNNEVFGMSSSSMASEQGDSLQQKMDMHGKIFTVDSVVTEPPAGLQKKQNGNWCCDICGHEELLKDDILTHRILHLSDDHSKQCPICEKKFSSLTSLRNHLTVHTGIKKFHCKYCGRKFGWKTQLAIHENLHTGKGLHHCQVCSKSFMTKWLLQRHLKIHLKDTRRSGSSNWSKTETKAAPQKYDNFLEISASNGLTSVSIESQTTKFPKCQECDLTFKGDDLLAYHLLEHNSAKQNVKCNVSIKNQTSLEETAERNWDISLENWSTSRYGNDDNTNFVDNMDSERLKFNNLKNPSKGSLTSIVSKLKHKVDEKQKSDEPAEVLIVKNSEDNSHDMPNYLKDSGAGIFKEGLTREYKLTESSRQPFSTSSDPFISGMIEVERTSESSLGNTSAATCNTKHIDQHCFTKSALAANEPSLSTQNELFEKDLRSYFVKQEKELTSLQSLVATLHGKVDSLTNIVTSQSLLINRIFLGGKMVVNGNLDFNIRQNSAE